MCLALGHCVLAAAACDRMAGASAWQAPPPAAQVRSPALPGGRVRHATTASPLPAKYKGVQEKIGPAVQPALAHGVHGVLRGAGHRGHRRPLPVQDRRRAPAAASRDFWFARNYDAVRDYVRIAGHAQRYRRPARDVGQHAALNVRPPIDATKDWALVRLARPDLHQGRAAGAGAANRRDHRGGGRQARIPDRPIIATSRPGNWPTAQAVRRGERFETADWKTIAQDFSEPDALLLHTCDTGGASSGSPLLLDTAHGPEVIGINVGTYVQSKVHDAGRAGVTKRLKADTVANTGVSERQRLPPSSSLPARRDPDDGRADARAADGAEAAAAL